jgi:gluconate 2-dehydrogenase gamma chain
LQEGRITRNRRRHSFQPGANAKESDVNDHDHDPSKDGSVFPRRRLLKDASLIAGGAIAVGVLGPELASAGPARVAAPMITLRQTSATPQASPVATPVVDLATYAPVNLTDTELTTLKAALDRLIPNDDLGPGANEMGVFVYIDRAIGRNPDALSSTYQQGLAALDTAAGSGGFAGLDAAKQDEILTSAEAGKLEGDPGGFFATLLQQTREGMFSDPIYGGNVGFAGWDLIGYSGIKLVWDAEAQALDAIPEPAHVSVAEFGGSAS